MVHLQRLISNSRFADALNDLKRIADAVRDTTFAIQVVLTNNMPFKRTIRPSPFASSSLTQVGVSRLKVCNKCQSRTLHLHTESSSRLHSHALTPPLNGPLTGEPLRPGPQAFQLPLVARRRSLRIRLRMQLSSRRCQRHAGDS